MPPTSTPISQLTAKVPGCQFYTTSIIIDAATRDDGSRLLTQCAVYGPCSDPPQLASVAKHAAQKSGFVRAATPAQPQPQSLCRSARLAGGESVRCCADAGNSSTICRSKPGTLHAAILRSPHAHADIVAIDTSRSARASGRARGRDRAGRCRADRSSHRRLCHADGILRHRGRSRALCRRAGRGRLRGDAVTSPRMRSIISGSSTGLFLRSSIRSRQRSRCARSASGGRLQCRLLPRVPSRRHRRRPSREAKRHSEITITYPRNSITPMEGYAVVAEHLPDSGGYDVMSNFQGPFSLHPVMARALAHVRQPAAPPQPAELRRQLWLKARPVSLHRRAVHLLRGLLAAR